MAQVNVTPALKHFEVSTTSYTAAVQDVASVVNFDPDHDLSANDHLAKELKAMRPVERAQFFISHVFGVNVDFPRGFDEALLTAQAMVEHAVRNDCVIEDADMTLMAAQKRVTDFLARPENKWLILTNFQGRSSSSGTPTITEKREIVEGVESTVAVTAEGKLKKGEKGRLAEEMYLDYLKTAADPNANQPFIELLVTKLGMSKAGATTYNYNMKAKHNKANITAKPKRV